jgi:hypothetical protein
VNAYEMLASHSLSHLDSQLRILSVSLFISMSMQYFMFSSSLRYRLPDPCHFNSHSFHYSCSTVLNNVPVSSS